MRKTARVAGPGRFFGLAIRCLFAYSEAGAGDERWVAAEARRFCNSSGFSEQILFIHNASEVRMRFAQQKNSVSYGHDRLQSRT